MSPLLGSPTSRWRPPLVAACLAVAACLTPARAPADEISECLLRQAGDLLEYLHNKKLENVGVLKFEVKDGPSAPSLHAGLLNTKIAEELENALVVSLGDDFATMNVLHDATAVAFRRDSKANYDTVADRRKLFDGDYPLAWGESKVKASAFLTGRVSLGVDKDGKADPRKAVVEVKAFDRSGAYLKTWDDEVRIDRVLLADSGKGFKLSKKPLGGKGIVVAPAEEADVRALAGGANTDGYPVELKILYGGVEQKMHEDDGPGKLNCFQVPPPGLEDTVSFVITNKGDKKIGVVLCVNGLSTLYEEPEGNPADMHKWVIEKGKSIEIEGFEGEDRKSVRPFKVVPPEGRKVANLPFADSDSIGLITMHVLPEGEPGEPTPAPGKGLRFPRHGVLTSPADVAKALQKYAADKGKGVISKTDKVKPDSVGFNPLENPILKETRVIRYTDAAP